MKTYNSLYYFLSSIGNLFIALRKAKKNKTGRDDVIEFCNEYDKNLLELRNELVSKTYKPKPLETFVLRDPKTRVISKSDFRDRVVHHALITLIFLKN